MLPARARLRHRQDFSAAVRRGRRAGARTLSVHVLPDGSPGAKQRPAQVGLVVGRAVGGAVVRNRVRRQLRHLVRERLADLPGGMVIVVRAAPPAAGRPTAGLAEDLDRALTRAGVGARQVA